MRGRDDDTGAMRGHDSRLSTAENFRRFRKAAQGRSPAYAELARAVADDPDILAFLDQLPSPARQPTLVFAAASLLLQTPPDHPQLRQLVRVQPDEFAALLRKRRTQTNEPARCATLLPALAELPPPLALLEVGASAGLTLLPDYYSYDYGGHHLLNTEPTAPWLVCHPHGPVPLPQGLPTVCWRAGLDLHPLDVTNPDHTHWLECLVWPGEADRLTRLQASLRVARRHPVALHRGDLVDDLPHLAATAPSEATLVIYHTAVLAYLSETRREAFAATVRRLNAVWLANEAPGITPHAPLPPTNDGFVLHRNQKLLATTDSHGAWIHWHTHAAETVHTHQ